MQMNIGETIKRVRKELGLSQEDLAEQFGLSVQAVSKWECGLSYPDITLLPQIADYLGVTLDMLLRGKSAGGTERINIPDDDKLRIVQCIGQRIVSKDEWKQSEHTEKIPIYFDKKWETLEPTAPIRMEIWGSADIDGSVFGNVKAGGSVNCDGVSGDVQAGGSVNCDGVSGDVQAGGSVTCDKVSGDVCARGSVKY